MAVQSGIAGIVVSNHGGRQLDGAVGSLEVLPEIVVCTSRDLTIIIKTPLYSCSGIGSCWRSDYRAI